MNEYVVLRIARSNQYVYVIGVFITETLAQEYINKQTDFVTYDYQLKILFKPR